MPRGLPPILTAAKLFVWCSPHEYGLYSCGLDMAFWQTISLVESTAFFYYRPLFLETQEKICSFFGKIYYVTILCKLYYVNRTNFNGRPNRKMHDVVAERSAAS